MPKTKQGKKKKGAKRQKTLRKSKSPSPKKTGAKGSIPGKKTSNLFSKQLSDHKKLFKSGLAKKSADSKDDEENNRDEDIEDKLPENAKVKT